MGKIVPSIIFNGRKKAIPGTERIMLRNTWNILQSIDDAGGQTFTKSSKTSGKLNIFHSTPLYNYMISIFLLI